MLTEAQREVLRAMANGHKMVFSQDGDMGYIAAEPYDEDQHGRFGPPDVITPAGRAALAGAKS